jgi:hypothetical protein
MNLEDCRVRLYAWVTEKKKIGWFKRRILGVRPKHRLLCVSDQEIPTDGFKPRLIPALDGRALDHCVVDRLEICDKAGVPLIVDTGRRGFHMWFADYLELDPASIKVEFS